MANDTAVATLGGTLFRKYLKEVTETIPSFAMWQEKLPVKDSEKIGEAFVVPVLLAIENGVSWSKSQNGAFNLNAAIDGEIVQAIINSSQQVVTSEMSYQLAAAASGDKEISADSAVRRIVKNNQIRARKGVEIDFIYGQNAIGVVESVASNVITLTSASWAAAMVSGMKNSFMAVFAPAFASKRVASGGASVANSNGKLISINTANRTLTFEASTTWASIAAGDLVTFGAGLNLAGAAGVDPIIANATPANVVYHGCAGLYKQLTTTSGTIFGIDYGANDVLQGNIIQAGGNRISFDMVQAGVAATMDHGNDSPRMHLYLNPLNWARLNADVAANRRYDVSYGKKGEEGVEQILYHSPIGTLEVVAHPFVKQGDAIAFSWDEVHRPGETDLTYQRAVGPGSDRLDPNGVYFRDLETKAGYQIRSYHSSAIYHECPAHAFVIQNINPA